MESLKIVLFTFVSSSFLVSYGCKPSNQKNPFLNYSNVSTEVTRVKEWDWNQLILPNYDWEEGTEFGNGLAVDVSFDNKGVQIVGNKIRFHVNPVSPHPSPDAPSKFNYRSEIRTTPWNIRHSLGTEQWIGWRYTFSDNYVIDKTAPITIYQNHPGVEGMSPQFELEIAALNQPLPAKGGEIQLVNAANGDRILLPNKPQAGETLDVVILVVYGKRKKGLLKLWLNDKLVYNKITSTVYSKYPWGGNNKWGIYHHSFYDNPASVQKSIAAGAGEVELFMGPLKIITRKPNHAEYLSNAYQLVRPE